MKSDFLIALTQLAAERNLPREIVLSAIEAALASAYRRDSVATGQDISVKLDPGSGEVTVDILKNVVEEVTDEVTEVSLADALALDPSAKLGEMVATETLPHSSGRIAAQTAKQVVMQRLREAERELVYEEYKDRVGEVFAVRIQRVEPRVVVVDMGRGEAVMPHSEQMPNERYRQGQRMKVLLQTVERSPMGTEIIVSRTDKNLLKRLFEMEVPEIYNGAVEIVTIAREAGFRSKVGVRARQDGVDPIGSCVGLRGVRIQNIVNELQGEKIDVLEWNADTARFIANALNPAVVVRVELDPTTQAAIAVVPDRQLSLAIGKEGQNARLAAKLTGWNVDIKSATEAEAMGEERAKIQAEAAAVAADAKAADPEPAEALVEEPIAVEPEVPEIPEEIAATVETVEQETAVEESAVELAPAIEEAIAEAIEPVAEVEEDELTPEALEQLTADAMEPDLEEEPEPEVQEVEQPSLRDVPDGIWSVPKVSAGADPGVIRFAEDITGLSGGVTARRARRTGNTEGNNPRGRKRKSRGAPRRRR
ncbi:MAG: transcription termination factor NusA [SAR202 cluster bacterium]|jgi:N utilization substance protein A|nr:transcription termination factor NusA [SAR202 cluster bacterium]MDP7104212.1 transcription termination factor NusA [SAR202 cluster bacterium]MDP7533067.1 transcription termination factor NusA [SAR202 cluster bacterium]HJO81843.1 transcription termination factor NusA [SAR202 cluster bacterium]